MGFEAKSGLNVNNQYGVRNTGGAIGISDDYEQLQIEFTGETLNYAYLPPVVIPNGALFRRAFLRVNEAFSLTGTSPTVIFGGTAPATNGIVLSQAELQTIGTKVPASVGTGTWAFASTTGTTAAEKVTKVLGGTTPVVSPTVGKAVLVVEFAFQTK